MTSRETTRRAFLAYAGAAPACAALAAVPVAAIASPALKGPAASLADLIPRDPPATAKRARKTIEQLWAEAEPLKLAYERACARADKLRKLLQTKIPKPDPSIIFSPENEADGLKDPSSDRSESSRESVHYYIYPHFIEAALDRFNPGQCETATIDGVPWTLWRYGTSDVALLKRQPVASPTDDAALRARLEARLELSLARKKLIDQMEEEGGGLAAEHRCERLADRHGALLSRIIKLKANTRRELEIKLAVYEECSRDGEDAESIIDDIMRLTGLKAVVSHV